MTRFSDIFGQDHAVAVLRDLWRQDRLPHGLIFAGPAGVGKATTAAALAALFLCEHPANGDSCGQCRSCRLLDAGTHPDYHVLTKEMSRIYKPDSKATGLSIDVIRFELSKKASSMAAMGKGKVFVLEQAELMVTEAQNAALKTLEEPWGRTLIVLLTDQEFSLLPTVRSRCQVVRFAALSDDLMLKELARRDVPQKNAVDAVEFAGGSLGCALRWLDEWIIANAGQLREALENLLAGSPTTDLAAWLRAASDDYAARQLAKDEDTSKTQATRDGAIIYFGIAGQILRQRLKAAQPTEAEAFCLAIDALIQAEHYLDANVTVALIFQQLAVKLESLFAYVVR